MPFGVGQFQNKQSGAAWVFLTGETLLAAGSFVGGGLSLYNAEKAREGLLRNDGTGPGYQARAQEAAIVGDVLAGSFIAMAITGILHAQATFVPEHPLTRKREIPQVSITPLIGPGGIGISGQF